MTKTTTMWIYGDSFAVDWKLDWSWQRQLAGNLTVDRVVNQASSGCSNEWTMLKFLEDDHQPGDVVLMFLTEPSRRLFWPEHPYYSNISSIMNTTDADELRKKEPDKVQAALDYWTHLHNYQLDELYTHMMTDMIRVKSIEREVTIRVLPCFIFNIQWTDLVPCYGTMTETVCDGEFARVEDMPKWYGQSIDTRANHMTLANHSVLAEKIYNSLRSGDPIDLEQGFERGFLELKDKLTHPGLCPQLVSMAMEPGNTIPREYFPTP